MGIFSRFKKDNSSNVVSNSNTTSKVKTELKSEKVSEVRGKKDIPVTNSDDSVVYIDFDLDNSSSWICTECETHNAIGLTKCIVCGLKR